jgi:hypothetical protein
MTDAPEQISGLLHEAAEAPGEPWETYYARQILRHFRPSDS